VHNCTEVKTKKGNTTLRLGAYHSASEGEEGPTRNRSGLKEEKGGKERFGDREGKKKKSGGYGSCAGERAAVRSKTNGGRRTLKSSYLADSERRVTVNISRGSTP